jgi:hypothetical protein
MPQKKSSRRLITPLVLFSLAGWALWALGRDEPSGVSAHTEPDPDDSREPGAPLARTAARERATWSKRRLATSLAFVTLFFAGAALSAGAGEEFAKELEGEATTATSTGPEDAAVPPEETPLHGPAPEESPEPEETTATDDTASDGAAAPEESSEPSSTEPDGGQVDDGGGQTGGGEQTGDAGDQGGENQGASAGGEDSGGESNGPGPAPNSGDTDSGGGPSAPASGGSSEKEPKPPAPPHLDEGGAAPDPAPEPEPTLVPASAPTGPADLDPEADAEGSFATVWLHRTLPDPTPPAKRLDQLFAETLAHEAKEAKVDWALVLGVLRAEGFDGGSMSTAVVRATADRLAELGAEQDAWRALLAYQGQTSFADSALALSRYNRAVGLPALVSGLEAAKPSLQQKLLNDERVSIYEGGRLDVAMGRTDVRVLVLLEYLAESHGQVTVSSLTTGHRVYSRPGVVSAHTYGLAVDVAALEETSIAGHQEPNGVTERAVRNILLLPAELQPRQVISLLGLGGASFPMANHWDHIHVGY